MSVDHEVVIHCGPLLLIAQLEEALSSQDSPVVRLPIRVTAVLARRWGVSTVAPAARAVRANAGSGGSIETMALVGAPASAMRCRPLYACSLRFVISRSGGIAMM